MLRVAVSGSAGTGKTTLARRLAERLSVPYLEEEMRRRIEAGLDLHALTGEQHRALVTEVAGRHLGAMEEAARLHGGFVADRGPLDMAAFWLHYHFHYDEPATEAFMRRMEDANAGLDALVMMPFEALALRADGVRTANRFIQLHYHLVLEGLCRRITGPVRVLWLPASVREREARVDWVLSSLRRG